MSDKHRFRVWDGERYVEKIMPLFIAPNGKLVCAANWDEMNPNVFRIERCTGQKDMKGLLIYENDIVNVYRPMMDSFEKAVVIWEDEQSCWVCKWLKPAEVKKDCWHASDSGTYFDGKNCYVIGNIHEWGKKACTPSTPK